MTIEEQKEFIGAIEARINELRVAKNEQDNFNSKYWAINDCARELQWVLEQFNQIKNK